MSRRRRGGPPAEKTAIGDRYVDQAISTISALQLRAMSVMTHYTPTRNGTVHMMFEPDDIDKACAVRGIVEPEGYRVQYDLENGTIFTMLWDAVSGPLPINEGRMRPLGHIDMAPLYEFIAQAREVHFQYEAVKHVLRHLNEKATPGAIRYYWPTVLKLCPGAPVFGNLQEVPTRFSHPHGINDYAALLRDTATTMAAAAMLPDDVEVRPRSEMMLTFSSQQVQRHGVTFRSDQMIYNL